ncbi:MAG TPA: c-type cytochrome [Candidatus Acidoferrum sp.]|nr:c-type cytochrome [Candidatus Acidoferrum sp.]
MKGVIFASGVATVFLVASASLAQQSTAPPAPAKGGKEDRKENPVYAELGKAPEKARSKHNPLEKDPEAPVAGRILFEQHCAECHGDTAQGGKKGPDLRAAEVQNAEPGAIFWILTNGVVRKGMPVWSKLPEPQRWQLVTYLKSLGVAPAKPVESTPPNPPAASTTDSPSRRR